MSKVVKNTQEMETELVAADTKTVVVDFYAPWCGPCKLIAPKLEEFQGIYPNVVTLKVNVDEAMELAEKYNISAMPTFLAIKEGNVVDTVVGADLAKLESIYKKYGAIESKPVQATAVTSACSASGGHPVKSAEVIKTIKIVEVMDPNTVNALSMSSSGFDAVDV